MNWKTMLGIGALSLAVVGCGDDEGGGGGGGGGGSFEDIASNIENPTGTLTAGNVSAVADAYAELTSTSSGGQRRNGSDYTMDCTAGGSFSVSAGESGESEATYDDCCFQKACCFSGEVITFTGGEDSIYMFCYSYDVDVDCGGAVGHFVFGACLNDTGVTYFSVEVEGDTYTVGGTSGNLIIIDSTGTEYACTGTGADIVCDPPL